VLLAVVLLLNALMALMRRWQERREGPQRSLRLEPAA
jgi:hypothetical protein